MALYSGNPRKNMMLDPFSAPLRPEQERDSCRKQNSPGNICAGCLNTGMITHSGQDLYRTHRHFVRSRINGGWFVPVDPTLPTTEALLFWRHDALPSVILLEPISHGLYVTGTIIHWQAFETEHRLADRDGWHVLITRRGVTHRLWFRTPPEEGRCYFAALPADPFGPSRGWAFLRLCRAFLEQSDPGPYRAMTPRTALLYRQSLAAMDARAAGASEWEIGQSLFGYQRSRDEWSDNAARGLVRRTLARGRRTLAGGYRRFLTWQAGGSNRRPRI